MYHFNQLADSLYFIDGITLWAFKFCLPRILYRNLLSCEDIPTTVETQRRIIVVKEVTFPGSAFNLTPFISMQQNSYQFRIYLLAKTVYCLKNWTNLVRMLQQTWHSQWNILRIGEPLDIKRQERPPDFSREIGLDIRDRNTDMTRSFFRERYYRDRDNDGFGDSYYSGYR